MDYPEFIREEAIEKQPMDEIVSRGVLDLDIPDSDLLRVLDMKTLESEGFYDNTLNLTDRRKRTNDYWKGKQIDYGKFYKWQVPYLDNVIYRDVETIIPIAVSKVPDIIVSPATEDPEKIKRAQKLQNVLDFQTKSRHIRDVLRRCVRHILLDFVGIIKCRWDKNKQTYVFEAARPNKVLLDHNAVPSTFGMSSENLEFVREWIEEPVKVVISKFPNKKEEILGGANIRRGTERQMASKIRYQEIWFTWYDDEGKPSEAVCWRYRNEILGKMKNPYWDYEGEEQVTGEESPTGEAITENIKYNHFKRPMKPYIIMNYQNTGASGPIDDTSPVEQVIPLQDVVNKRGRQITELADKANPKKVFSSDFLTKEQATAVTDDPQESIVGNAPVREGFTHVPGIPPNPVLYQDLVQNRLEIDNIIGAHSTTRGERVPEESGVARQITREGDFGRIDDLVLSAVEPAADEIVNWMVHFMKIFGTKEHFVQVLGGEGESEFVEFDRDTIDDGINVTVKASTVDKTERRSVATQLASSGAIDPLSLFEDLGAKNPKERAKRLVAFNADPTGAAYMELILGDEKGAKAMGGVGEGKMTPLGGGAGRPAAPPTGAGMGAPPAEIAPLPEEGGA